MATAESIYAELIRVAATAKGGQVVALPAIVSRAANCVTSMQLYELHLEDPEVGTALLQHSNSIFRGGRIPYQEQTKFRAVIESELALHEVIRKLDDLDPWGPELFLL